MPRCRIHLQLLSDFNLFILLDTSIFIMIHLTFIQKAALHSDSLIWLNRLLRLTACNITIFLWGYLPRFLRWHMQPLPQTCIRNSDVKNLTETLHLVYVQQSVGVWRSSLRPEYFQCHRREGGDQQLRCALVEACSGYRGCLLQFSIHYLDSRRENLRKVVFNDFLMYSLSSSSVVTDGPGATSFAE